MGGGGASGASEPWKPLPLTRAQHAAGEREAAMIDSQLAALGAVLTGLTQVRVWIPQ